LSIVTGIPYDRAQTSMRKFDMCADCLREYRDPTDRRFHAQPNACPACGPKIWLEDAQGDVTCDDPLTETAQRLMQGQIIAIKGIGGFHLACDATNAKAVQRLRDRKNRKAKPFAIMARDARQIRDYCHLSDAEADLLTTAAAPIVLLKARKTLPAIAPRLDRIGVMLPHSPLHHLLMAQVKGPLVMTSGNPSNTPQVTRNAHARSALAQIADMWLMHDRDIVNRLDDSLLRMDHGGPSILRRGRGFAPAPVPLHTAFADAPPTLAMGAELKSTFCLLKNGQAIPSQHMGDLTTAETYADFRAKIALFGALYDFAPQVIAVDQHPDYLSTRWGAQLAKQTGAALVKVQHHHAHMVSCLAEHAVPPDDALSVGVILDGTGFGADGTIWGGEVLLGDYHGFERKAHVQPIALPGGEHAARAPWRNLVAHLIAVFGEDWEHQIAGTPVSKMLAGKPTALIGQMIKQGVNAPLASSTGRLFDAVAAALGIAFDLQHFEGQAAMELEALMGEQRVSTGYPAEVLGLGIISWKPLWLGLIADLRSGARPATIAARFHLGLANALVGIVTRIAADAQTYRIVLSGGVLQNRFLMHALVEKLHAQGLTVLHHKNLPANDGGIALGQACCAALNHADARNAIAD
jgi:hydrogenase maturation protein HypF